MGFRATHTTESLFGAFVDLLAYARPDRNADGSDLLAGVGEDPDDAACFAAPSSGSIPCHWVAGRMVGTARLLAAYVDVWAVATVAALRPVYLEVALRLGFEDFDAAAFEWTYPRDLDHRAIVDLYERTDNDVRPAFDGV